MDCFHGDGLGDHCIAPIFGGVYVINTSDSSSSGVTRDGFEIRCYATENNVTMFTSLDTVRVLLDVLEETTLTISTIDA